MRDGAVPRVWCEAGSVRGSSAALEEEKESPAPAAAATALSCRCPRQRTAAAAGGGDGRAAQLRTESSRARDSGSSRPCPPPLLCSLCGFLLWLPEAECGGRHARIGTRGVLACSLLSPQSTPYRRCCAPPPALPLAASQPTDSELRECRRSFLGCRRPRRYHFP